MSDSARSPLSGCAILIAAVLMLLFLIGFSIWVPFRQFEEIKKFTQTEAVPIPVESTEAREAEARALVERFESFRSQLADEEVEAQMKLTADDLNLAIALAPSVKDLRGTFRVKEIKDGELVIDLCYRINGLPEFGGEKEEGQGPLDADSRYLVGTLYSTPLLTKKELALRNERLAVANAEVPEGFMGHFSTHRLFEMQLNQPGVGELFGRLTKAEIIDDHLVIARIPGDPLPGVVTDEAFQKSGGKIAIFVGGAMVVFLILAGVVLYIGYKAQLRKIAEEEGTNEKS